MSEHERTVVLLTASIDPMGRAGVRRTDPETRLRDYAAALRRWLEAARELSAEIVFCENSGWPLDDLRALARDERVTFLQFRGNDYEPALGKGYGEALILDRFIGTVLDEGESRAGFVIKCTGRLFVDNVRAIVSRLPPETDLACAVDGRLTWADSRFLVARAPTFAKYLHGLAPEVDERRGVYLEHVLMRRVAAAIADGRSWQPLPVLPRYVGTGATGNRRYDGVRERGRWIVHSALRALRYRPRSPL